MIYDFTNTIGWVDDNPPLSRAQVLAIFQNRRVLSIKIRSILEVAGLLISDKIGDAITNLESALKVAKIPGISVNKFLENWGLTPTAVVDTHTKVNELQEEIQKMDREIVSHNSQLIMYVIKFYRPNNYITYTQMFAEGVRGCYRAINNFDPNRGIAFSTFAFSYIRAYISKAIEKQTMSIVPSYKEFSLNTLMTKAPIRSLAIERHSDENRAECSLERHIDTKRLWQRVEATIKKMKPKQRRIITDYLSTEKSPDKLAAELGITRARVFQIRQEALKKIGEEIGDLDLEAADLSASVAGALD